MGQYIWQHKNWPKLEWNASKLIEPLARVRKCQGKTLAKAELLGLRPRSEIIVEDALKTAAIEGETYDRNTVRSSVARRLGLPTAGLPPEHPKVQGLVEMLLDATSNHKGKLTKERLGGWHAGLFPTGHSGIHKITTGRWRQGKKPMQVISGPMGKEKVHFEALPSKDVSKEMKQFMSWWEKRPKGLDGLLRAGIAHFWFITIHPFDDGNGRIARAITDMAIAQDENIGLRLYSLSAQISKSRNEYYDVLERSQRGTCDITAWMEWFLDTFDKALAHSEGMISRVTFINEFWNTHRDIEINARQRKVLKMMLEGEPEGFEGGITNKKYVVITKASRETAKRDLADMERKGLINRNPAQGRSISYSLRK